MEKTNAMRILDGKKIEYLSYTYDGGDGKIDGISVAQKIGKPPEVVYKTLVVQGTSKGIYVLIIPVAQEIDFKKAAKVTGEKKLEMIPVKDILTITGYIRGGCSPVGMRKLYPTYVDESAAELSTIVVSAGKIGAQMEVALPELLQVIGGKLADLIKEGGNLE
ncbi:MAG: Cys-tRNA(Pro) deacylase [Desulfocucumaceae bacterium]